MVVKTTQEVKNLRAAQRSVDRANELLKQRCREASAAGMSNRQIGAEIGKSYEWVRTYALSDAVNGS